MFESIRNDDPFYKYIIHMYYNAKHEDIYSNYTLNNFYPLFHTQNLRFFPLNTKPKEFLVIFQPYIWSLWFENKTKDTSVHRNK